MGGVRVRRSACKLSVSDSVPSRSLRRMKYQIRATVEARKGSSIHITGEPRLASSGRANIAQVAPMKITKPRDVSDRFGHRCSDQVFCDVVVH